LTGIEFLVVVIFGGVTLVTILQVFFRYGLNAPLMWAEELARYLFVWGVLIATGIGLDKGSHIGVEFVVDKMPRPLKRAVEYFSYLLMIFLCFYLIYYGWQLVGKVTGTMSPAMGLKMSYVYAAGPVSAMIWTIILINRLIAALCPAKRSSPQEKNN